MSDVKQKLQMWKEKNPNGSYETLSTITIKTDTMELTAKGNSLEEAFSQIESICNEKEIQSGGMASQPNTFQQNNTPNNTMAQINTGIGQNTDVFNGKKPVRIHSPSIPLAVGESTVEYGGLTYVVK